MNYLVNAYNNYKTTIFGFIASGATYEASLNGPHVSIWKAVAGIAVILLGASAADATSITANKK